MEYSVFLKKIVPTILVGTKDKKKERKRKMLAIYIISNIVFWVASFLAVSLAYITTRTSDTKKYLEQIIVLLFCVVAQVVTNNTRGINFLDDLSPLETIFWNSSVCIGIVLGIIIAITLLYKYKHVKK